MGFRKTVGTDKKTHGYQNYMQIKRGMNSDYDKRGLLETKLSEKKIVKINTYPLDY